MAVKAPTKRTSKEIPWTEPLATVDLRAEASVAAEEQLAEDRADAKATLIALADAITGRRKSEASRLLADLTWLEHRITQTESQHVALWCRECAKEGVGPAELPGRYWMCFECLLHAAPMLERSARSWERSLFS